jgi:hypothetical protein
MTPRTITPATIIKMIHHLNELLEDPKLVYTLEVYEAEVKSLTALNVIS